MSGGAYSAAFSAAFDVVESGDGGDGEGGGEVAPVLQCKLKNFTGKAFTEYNKCKKAAAAAGGRRG